MLANNFIAKSNLIKTNALKFSRVPCRLLLLMLLTLPATLQAQFNYTINNGSVRIWGYTGPGGDVTIPSTIDGLPVTVIGDFAFANNTSLTNVTLPNSLISVGQNAFYECTNLATVNIPNGVATIGRNAFADCASLSSVNIPNSVTTIDFAAFHSCLSLTNVQIGAGVTNIYTGGAAGSSAFAWCTNLIRITVDDLNGTYSSLEGVLFNKDQTTLVLVPAGKMGTYLVPNSVTRIGPEAFYSCRLTNVNIPTGVTNIGLMAFMYCTGLSRVTIPDTLTTISQKAFYRCSNLVEVVIPSTVTSIEYRTFAYCTSLRNINIPATVTNIGSELTIGCMNLIAITVDPMNPAYSSLDGVFFDKSQTTLIQFPGGKTGSYIIPNGVTSFDFGAFAECRDLTNVTIPSSVTNIGSSAFDSCANLTGVYFQGNAPTVGSYVWAHDDIATIYYLPGTSNWGTSLGGIPTVLWNPVMQTSHPTFGVGPNCFGFTITGTPNIPVVIEACTNLALSAWVPLQTLSLTNGEFYFSDPEWMNQPGRFYRLRSP